MRSGIVVIVALLLVACAARVARPRRLTGTCEGACEHYLACKNTGGEPATATCISECRQVFSDADSLRAFESLSCPDAVEYVDGNAAAATL